MGRQWQILVLRPISDVGEWGETINLQQGEYVFYGVTIENSDDPHFLIYHRSAEITRTELLIDNGPKLECRWWTRDYSEKDKLFTGGEFDFDDRRKRIISAGSSEHLVIAYKSVGNRDYYLFDITSDVGDKFWERTNNISEFPKRASLKIVTTSVVTTINLTLDLNADGELIISEIL